MANPDILFRGIPRGRTRGYTAQVIEAVRPGRVVIPRSESFALADTAVVAGVAPEDIVASDISLYSTALGNAIMGQDWRLEVKSELAEVVRPYLTDPVSKAAAVMLVLRILQYTNKRPSVYSQGMVRELVVNAETYFAQLKAQIEDKAGLLHGLDYQARDMWETLEAHRHDPNALLLVNPPRYDGAEARMFRGAGDALDWDAPDVRQFTEQDYSRLMALLGDSEALALMYYATPGEDPAPLWGGPWRSVFADKPRNKRVAAINWIIANAEPAETMISRPKEWDMKAKFPLFTGQVTDDAQLRVRVVRREAGEYYKDLLIHKLAGGMAERYIALLLNGHLLAMIGLSLKDWRGAGRKKASAGAPAYLLFAFTVPHDKYKRLHKLTLMAAASSWFWEQALADYGQVELIGYPTTVQSTMLTPHPENKTARGVMKLENRERLSNGSYRLRYRAAVVGRTPGDTLKLWLKKYGAQTR